LRSTGFKGLEEWEIEDEQSEPADIKKVDEAARTFTIPGTDTDEEDPTVVLSVAATLIHNMTLSKLNSLVLGLGQTFAIFFQKLRGGGESQKVRRKLRPWKSQSLESTEKIRFEPRKRMKELVG
jgi:hypothetical protein